MNNPAGTYELNIDYMRHELNFLLIKSGGKKSTEMTTAEFFY